MKGSFKDGDRDSEGGTPGGDERTPRLNDQNTTSVRHQRTTEHTPTFPSRHGDASATAPPPPQLEGHSSRRPPDYKDMTSETLNHPGTPSGVPLHNPSPVWGATEERCSSLTSLEALKVVLCPGCPGGELGVAGGVGLA
ncbi:unnamed protein product [Boreogadus saida]